MLNLFVYSHKFIQRIQCLIWNLIIGFALFAAFLPAAVSASASGNVNGFYGSFSTEVPIAVPEYHDLQPKLKLVYSSSGGNGLLGVGWSLSGISYIQRGLPGGGAPQYDVNDAFFLDGMELLPSTQMGGTHCTKMQNYARIVKEADNTWSVIGTNGNVAKYTPLHITNAGTFRWYLTSVQDRFGNKVEYNYWVDGLPVVHVYLDRIAYNGAEIKFYRESRTDKIVFATGVDLGETNYRIKTIDIKVNGQQVRAYALHYGQSQGTARSILESVQQYGNDTSVDSTGAITGGTALPPMQMETIEPNQGFDAASWTVPAQWGHDAWTWIGDFNGDGLMDIASASGSNVYMKLSNGNGFDTATWTVPAQWGTYKWTWTGDFNGDGLTDIASARGSNVYMKLSNGNGFDAATWTVPAQWGSYLWTWVQDFNGDGLTDIACASGSNVYMKLSNGNGFEAATWTVPAQWGSYKYTWVQDFNGDGRPDIASASGSNVYMKLSESFVVDKLNSISNGLGGSTQIEYTPSSSWQNTYLPQGMVLQTVSALTTDDGRGNVFTTNYQYEGGLWSNTDKRFLGFRKVTSVIDAQGNYTETYYHQKEWSTSKPEYTYFKNNQGDLYSYSHYRYQENTAPPYTSLLTERWDYECNLSENYRRSLVQFAYDEYSNVIHAYEYGDYDRSGDEKTTIRGYVPNHEAYVMGYPAYENVYAGIGTDGALIQQVINFYDNNTAYTQAPKMGKATEVRKWNSATGDYVSTKMSYNSFGKLIQQTDERGFLSSIEYDSTYNYFPVKATNALGQESTREWNYVMGQEIAATDANGARTESAYDPLGRITHLTYPDGAVVETQYLDWGDPHMQRVRTIKPDGSVDGLWSEAFQDGLGRVYKTVDEGGTIQEKIYSSTGSRVWKESLPYRSGEIPQWTHYSYDGANRVRTVTQPDGARSEIVYANDETGQPYEATYDEVGNEKVIWKNVNGNVLELRERNGADYYHTNYEYNLLGYLTRSVDDQNNISTFEWDSLGRKLVSNDPNLGQWTYSYDNGGLLLSQTDAKGQTLTFTYDALGRMLSKNYPDSSQVKWHYDEPEHGASIGRLTRVEYPNGQKSQIWDIKGQVIRSSQTVSGTSKTMLQTYDALGRIATVTYPDGELLTHYYNDAGQLDAIPGYVNKLTWSSVGQLESMTYANGVTSKFDYDGKRYWLKNSVVSNASNEELYQASYAYDAAARIQEVSSTSHPLMNVQYQYDALNRLLQVSGAQEQSFQYDAIGNITENSAIGSYSYGENGAGPHAVTSLSAYADNPSPVNPSQPLLSLNEIQTLLTQAQWDIASLQATCSPDSISREAALNVLNHVSPTGVQAAEVNAYTGTLEYDANGNMTHGLGRHYVWDYDNRLTSVTQAGKSSTFLYDADGTRIQKNSSSGVTRYFGSRIEEGSEGLVKYYYAGPILVAKRVDGQKTFYHGDHLGSIRLMTGDEGTVVKSYDYSAFGELIKQSGHATNTRAYTGHIHDTESDLTYMQARYYDPVLARFISADTIVPDALNSQALNRYSYVYNNPILNTDPTGHAPVAAAVASAVAVGASTASTWVAATAYVGAGISVAGYLTEDPTLSTIGAVMTGIVGGFSGAGTFSGLKGASGSIIGGSLGYATSPLSPLDPGVKQAVGWAFSAYGSFSKHGWNFKTGTQFILHQSSNHAAQLGVNRLAKSMGLDSRQLNSAFTIVSFIGNEITDTRLHMNHVDDNGVVGNKIEGMFTRKKHKLAAGVSFDVVDVILGFQGLPTATCFEYLRDANHSLPLLAHSLGTLNANNLTGWHIPQNTVALYSLPIGNAGAPGVSVNNGAKDFVNGFKLSKFLNPYQNTLKQAQQNLFNAHTDGYQRNF